MSDIHEAIKAVNRGMVEDQDLDAVLDLRDQYSVTINGKEYSLRYLVSTLAGAHQIAFHRYGTEWAIKDGDKAVEDRNRITNG